MGILERGLLLAIVGTIIIFVGGCSGGGSTASESAVIIDNQLCSGLCLREFRAKEMPAIQRLQGNLAEVWIGLQNAGQVAHDVQLRISGFSGLADAEITLDFMDDSTPPAVFAVDDDDLVISMARVPVGDSTLHFLVVVGDAQGALAVTVGDRLTVSIDGIAGGDGSATVTTPVTPDDASDVVSVSDTFGFKIINDTTLTIVGLDKAVQNPGAFQYDLAGATVTEVVVCNDTYGWGAAASLRVAVVDGAATITLAPEELRDITTNYSASKTELAVVGTYEDGSPLFAYLAHGDDTPWHTLVTTGDTASDASNNSVATTGGHVVPSKMLRFSPTLATLDIYSNAIGVYISEYPVGVTDLYCGFFDYNKSYNSGHSVDKEITLELGHFASVPAGGFVCVVDGTHEAGEGVVFFVTGEDLARFAAAKTPKELGSVMYVPDHAIWQRGTQPDTGEFEYRNDGTRGARIRYCAGCTF